MSFDLGRIDITYVDKVGLLVGKCPLFLNPSTEGRAGSHLTDYAF